MQTSLLNFLSMMIQLLRNSSYTPYLVVGLCFLILVVIQIRKVRGRNKKRRMLSIETHEQNFHKRERSNPAVTFGGEILDLDKMTKRQIIEIRGILFFLPLFFFSILLVLFSPLFWPIPFIGLLGVFVVTMLGAFRMSKYGNKRSYITGKELLGQLAESKRSLNFKPTFLINQVELSNFFNYLSCESRLKLDDRLSSTWTLYVGLRAIKTCDYISSNSLFSVDKKGIKTSQKLRDSIKAEDIKKITDFLNDEDGTKFCFSIESWENHLIAKTRFAIKEPQRVTNARVERVAQSFELLEEYALKIFHNLQT